MLQVGDRGDRVRQRLLRLLDLHRRRRGRHRAVVRRALPQAPRDGVPGSRQLLPPLRRPHRRARPWRPAHGIWHEINGKNLRENIAADPRAGVADPAQGRRPPRHRGRAAPLCTTRRVRRPSAARRSQAGRSASEASSANVLVVVDVLELPQQRGTGCARAWPPSASTGRMSLRTLLPTMQNRVGSTSSSSSRSGVGRRGPSRARSRRARSGGRARVVDLVRLVDEVALGDQHQPVVAADLGEHLGHVGEQPHRLLQHGPGRARPARR